MSLYEDFAQMGSVRALPSSQFLRGGPGWVTPGYLAGKKLRTAGFTNPENNLSNVEIVSVSLLHLTVGVPLVDELTSNQRFIMLSDLLEGFEVDVRLQLNRGDRYDSEIASAVPQAINFIERNHTFEHMKKERSLTLLAGSQTLDVGFDSGNVTLPVKTALFVQREDNGMYLPKIQPEQVSLSETGVPNGWYQSGPTELKFDNTANKNYALRVKTVHFTRLDPDVIIPELPDLLLYQTMLHLAPVIRSKIVREFYLERRQESLSSAIAAQQELELSGASSEVTPYADEQEALRIGDLPE